MYFTINSAFSHFMSLFGLSENETTSTELIDNDHVFDIFLNNCLPPLLLDNSSLSLAPLDPPKHCQTISNYEFEVQGLPNSPFFPFVRHTVMKNLQRLISFLHSSPHIVHVHKFHSCMLILKFTCLQAQEIAHIGCCHDLTKATRY